MIWKADAAKITRRSSAAARLLHNLRAPILLPNEDEVREGNIASTNLHEFSQIRFVEMSADLWTMGNVANILRFRLRMSGYASVANANFQFQCGRVSWSFELEWENGIFIFPFLNS